MGVLDLQQHLGALVADRLERADRLAELLAHLRVADRHVEAPARGTQHLGGRADRTAPQETAQQRSGLAGRAEHGVAGDRHLIELEVDPPGRQVHALDRRELDSRRGGIDEEEGRPFGSARRNQQDVGHVSPRHEALRSGERPAVR
jgi:hypothetical protein